MKRHRICKGKLKVEHCMIKDLRSVLETMASWEMIKSIIPGRIKRTGRCRPGIQLRATTEVPDGLKCIAKASGCVQEVFIVTNDRNELRRQLSQSGYGK